MPLYFIDEYTQLMWIKCLCTQFNLYFFLIDIDECANSTLNICEQRCINTEGSFMCACNNTGFQLNDDGITCSGEYQQTRLDSSGYIYNNHSKTLT